MTSIKVYTLKKYYESINIQKMQLIIGLLIQGITKTGISGENQCLYLHWGSLRIHKEDPDLMSTHVLASF